MKTQLKVDDFIFEIEEDTMTETWEKIAELQEVFGDTTCTAKVNGKVQTSDNVVFRVRKDKEDNKYYELVCMEPGDLMYFKKEFGVHKKGGGLFPKRPDKDDKTIVLGYNGWFKWVGDQNSNQQKT